MITERHARGKIIGSEAEVCPDTKLCGDSYISGRADVFQSELVKSRVHFDSKVRTSVLNMSSVGSEKERCDILRCYLEGAVFEGGTAINAKFYNSTVKGNPFIRGRGNGVIVANSAILDDARVLDAAVVGGITLNRKMRVGASDVWDRQPRYFEINNEIADVGITEAKDGFAYIQCQRKPMYKWIKKRKLWQKVAGWSDEMIHSIHLTFEKWLDEVV